MRPLPASPQLCQPALASRRRERVMVSLQEKCMKALRWGCPWQGGGLLLGLLLWSLLPSPTASQDRATQLPALQTAIPDPQQRIASSVRTATKIVSENGMATARAQM